MRADRAATWAAFDGDEAAQLIAEDRGAQTAKKAKRCKARRNLKVGSVEVGNSATRLLPHPHSLL